MFFSVVQFWLLWVSTKQIQKEDKKDTVVVIEQNTDKFERYEGTNQADVQCRGYFELKTEVKNQNKLSQTK